MRVLVTNCTRNSGLALLRALARSGSKVLGADDRALPFQLRSRYAAAPYELLPTTADPSFSSRLLELLDRKRPDVLIPGRAMEVACRMRDEIALRSRSLLPSPEAFDVLHDKSRLLERCTALGIPAPQVFEPDSAIRFLATTPGGQLVVKPRRDAGGGKGVHFVVDAAGLSAACRNVNSVHGASVITEYVPGPTENLRAVHLLFDSESRLIAFFVLRKLRIWPSRVGVSAAAVSSHETGLVERLLPLFQGLRWQGPADAEYKIDESDGEAKVIEINPRFSGAIHFPIACGVNMPLLYCRAAMGEALAEAHRPEYRAGVRYLDPRLWLASVFEDLCRSHTGLAATLRHAREELRGPRVRTVYEMTDPAPLLGKLLMMARDHA